jgi:pyruvate dehydrogenase E1 component
VSTTIAFVRLLRQLMRDPSIGRRIVPIIPDEARTFGMDSLFREFGIYSSLGQLYESVDASLLLSYYESKEGQILEEGITEAGSMASFTASSTSYAAHGEPTIPFYTFYSMFGFQRTGDLIWALGDIRGRGFLMGATAGRTTLNGEGLQHQDGHSHLLATALPNIRAYDPAYACELAVIIEEGLRCMYEMQQDVFYYITIYNENIAHPALVAGSEEGILKGLYRFCPPSVHGKHEVQLLASGSIMPSALQAREILAHKFGIGAGVWSATSYQQLRHEALAADRWNRLHPEAARRVPYVTEALRGVPGPIVAATDFVKTIPDLIRPWVKQHFVSLGTDGFGMSDTREALRRHFEVDAGSMVIAALHALFEEGRLDAADVAAAIRELGIDPEKADPSGR